MDYHLRKFEEISLPMEPRINSVHHSCESRRVFSAAASVIIKISNQMSDELADCLLFISYYHLKQ